MTDPDNDDPNLAHWLQEVGRRRLPQVPVPSDHKEEFRRDDKPRNAYVTRPALLYLLAVAAMSCAIYYFADVELQIVLLRSLVVFITG